MRLKATATMVGGFPVDKKGNLLRFAHNPDALSGDEELLKQRSKHLVFVDEKSLRAARIASVDIRAGDVYPDNKFQGLPGVVEHLLDRGVLLDVKPKKETTEAPPPMGGGSTKVQEGLLDARGEIRSPNRKAISDEPSGDF